MKKNRLRKNNATLYLIMRLSLTQIVFSITFASFTYAAHDGKAQEILERNITLHADKAELKSVLSQLEEKADVKFAYSSKAIRANREVEIHSINQKLSATLKTLLTPLDISFEVTSSGRILLTTSKSDVIKEQSSSQFKEKDGSFLF